ncbi:adenylate/guanylate cyclase domain-containing protein [Candidatus Peregrinibacteria bacterium]|nr:adenylate/guanylate cyclase domain-containing protein [Candidatus Peregrinibacteria bacterium]
MFGGSKNAMWKNKKLAAVVSILLISVICGILSYFHVLNAWQNKLTNSLFEPTEVSSEIVIVGLDDEVVNASDMDVRNNRDLAEVFENLAKLGPKVVAVDYFFLEESDGAAAKEIKDIFQMVIDRDLGKREIGNAFLPYIKAPHGNDVALKNAFSEIDELFFASYPEAVEQIENGSAGDMPVLGSLDTFTKGNGDEVNVAVEIDPQDSVVRKYYTQLKTGDGDTLKSLAFKVAETVGSPYVKEIPLIDANGRMHINYFGMPGSFKQISAYDLYKNDVKRSEIEGKIVLFGPTSRAFNDFEHTPIAPKEQMMGVEIHANALQTILEGRFLQDVGTVAKIGIIVMMSGIACSAFMFLSIRSSLAVLVLLGLGYMFGNKVAFERGVILDQIYPYLALGVSLVTVYIYKYFTESKEKTFIADAFGSYVSPDVLKEIIKDPSKLKLGGEEKIVTVLFSDIKDFTSISEKMSAHGLVTLLNEYFSEMSEVIIRNGGTVDKFEGDAIMAVFGAPLHEPNHAALACRTALEMQRKLAELRSRLISEGRPELHARIGVNSGPVVAGNIGSSDRFDYTVMGDTVNLGSRLEGANKMFGTTILVGRNTYDAVQASEHAGMFNFKPLDKIKVKGKEAEVEVFGLE